MSRTDDAISRIERQLQAAADRFAAGLRRHLAEPAEAPEEMIDPAERVEHLRSLAAEDGRLRSKARRNAPSYDLNRHIAVRRLLARLGLPVRAA